MPSIVCIECSAEVPDSCQQCPECGFPFASLVPTPCPSCHNLVVFSTDICPSCGAPYPGVDGAGAGGASLADDGGGASPAVTDEAPVAHVTGEPTAPVATGEAPEASGSGEAPVADDTGEGLLTRTGTGPEPLAEAAALDRQVAAPEVNASQAVSLTDKEFIVNAIINHITEVKLDLINNPIKAFLRILTEMDKANGDLHRSVLEQGAATLSGVQETALGTLTEITRVTTLQAEASLTKSQELALTIVSEISAAVGTLKEAQSAAAEGIADSIGKLPTRSASVPAEAATATPATIAPLVVPAAGDLSEYILYLCIAMLVFTVLNVFITIYAVKLIR